MSQNDPLYALTPIDGRYQCKLKDLSAISCEYNLIKLRLFLEIKYLIALSQLGIAPKLNSQQKLDLLNISEQFTSDQAREIKTVENKIGHDVKAIEYFLRDKMSASNIPGMSYIHFALTSEDINNLAYSLMLKQGLQTILPILSLLIENITDFASNGIDLPLLARTHGQAAVPSTFGKEMSLFAYRLAKEYSQLSKLPIEGKLNGAVGNFNAHQLSHSGINWLQFSQKFIKGLGLKPTLYSTQILPSDSYIKIFQSLQLMNQILLGFVQDIWRYISDDYLLQKHDKNQIGSSTMPQKINPIDFENCEGNLGMANALLYFFNTKLPISRLQRDLSDSTVKRNIGTAFAYTVLAFQSCIKGLSKINYNLEKVNLDLNLHWEILAEGLQTVLRTQDDAKAYEKLRQFSQGKIINAKSLHEFIQRLDINKECKQKLLKLTPYNYLGLTKKLTKKMITDIYKLLN